MKSSLKMLLALAVVSFGADSFAALNAYLKITGKSVSKIVKLDCATGACTATVEDLKAGKYTLTLCDSKGQPLALKVKEKGNRTKCIATLRYEYEVKSPRDVATGQASGIAVNEPGSSSSGVAAGKRMHKPITVTKTLDKASPVLLATVDLDGDGMLDITLNLAWTDGAITAVDDWESRSN